MDKKRGIKTFNRFLLSYFVILMIPVLVGVYAYNKTVQVIEEDAKRNNLAVLNQSKETLDIRLQEVEQLATDLALNPKITQFMNVTPPFTDNEYYQVYEVFKDITKYRLNMFIADYYLHFPNSQILITTNTVYNLQEGYSKYFEYGNLSYEEWLEQIEFDGRLTRYLKAEDIYYKSQHHRMLTYQQMIIPGYSKLPMGSVFVMFPEEEITKMFDHLDNENEGWAYILDEDRNIIYGTSPDSKLLDYPVFSDIEGTGFFDHEVNDEKMFISYTTSDYNHWTYIAASPYETVLARADYIKEITSIVTLFAIIIGLIFAILMAWRNSKPIREIASMIKQVVTRENHPKENEYAFIQGSVSKLIHKHNDLKSELDQQIPFLQANFLDRLFKGEFKSMNELSIVSQQSQIPISGNTFIVMVLHFSGYEELVSKEIIREMNEKKVLITTVLDHMDKRDNLFIHNIKEDTLAVLLSLNKDTTSIYPLSGTSDLVYKLEKRTNQLLKVLRKESRTRINIGVGNIYQHPMEVWKSYNEAQRALQFGRRSNELTFWYKDVPLESNFYYYPIDMEMQIMNMVQSGNLEELKNLFSHLEKENFQKRKLTDSVVYNLLSELNGTMIKIFESFDEMKVPFDDCIVQFDNQSPLLDYYSQIKESFSRLCETVEKKKENQSILLKERMLKYIENNYSDYNIGLSLLATHFNLSESYVSTFFKELTGENFSTYLESMRMKEARKLLAETQLSVSEIANKIGYTSDKTFRRAFKRYHGGLPASYRDSASNITNNSLS